VVDEQERQALATLAAALAGDPAKAAELLGEVRVLSGKDGHAEDDALPATRGLLVQRFLRRRRPASSPSEAGVGLSPELEAVRRRLDQLAPLPRPRPRTSRRKGEAYRRPRTCSVRPGRGAPTAAAPSP
jgi:hypothetical protein